MVDEGTEAGGELEVVGVALVVVGVLDTRDLAAGDEDDAAVGGGGDVGDEQVLARGGEGVGADEVALGVEADEKEVPVGSGEGKVGDGGGGVGVDGCAVVGGEVDVAGAGDADLR